MTASELIAKLSKLPPDEELYLEDEYGDAVELRQLYRSPNTRNKGKLILNSSDYLDETWWRNRPDLAAAVIK